MIKKLVALTPLTLIALAGCTTVDVDLPGSKFSNQAIWTYRTLENVRFYYSDVNAVAEAAITAGRSMGLYYAGDNFSDNHRELFFCGPKFVKITVDVERVTPARPRDPNLPAGQPYTEVSVVWGSMGDLEKSRKFVSEIAKLLPSEADRR
ncbi:MAG: hypothetical protein K6B46_00535 [Opitutales bacterium]|nr:hypothetical protein [Opitutales bacterium]